jgi:hypothetical protein
MPLQYILDESGKTTAVVVPIAEWEVLTEKHQDLKDLGKKPKKKGLSAFIGTISPEEADRMQKYVEQSRNEWERDIS